MVVGNYLHSLRPSPRRWYLYFSFFSFFQFFSFVFDASSPPVCRVCRAAHWHRPELPVVRLGGSEARTVGAAGAVGAGLSRVVSSESDPGTARDRVAGGSEEATPCLPERRLTYERTAAEGPDGMMFGWRAGRAPEASMDIPSQVKYETTEVLC